MRISGIPAAPLMLTAAGVLPFAAGAGVMWMARENPVLQAQAGLTLLVYGAVILSFLGGLRWGAEVVARGDDGPRAGVLICSVIGSLTGWGLVLYGVLGALDWQVYAAAAAAHVVHGFWDTGTVVIPAWMRRLRALGTFGAAAGLLAGGAAYFVL
ncbi:DUF3429 domain-containing protein [Hyphomonas sp.]|jgi:hypothetical protein|uniref:DUF3429 domain-containing protein n=1 Tax=Hyphomonas sp. TaxID=87 RepID=UPI0025C5A6ED|nr:DUF3429 domain-containing protein [Hyphomonas sp.]